MTVDDHAILEFQVEINGITVNGVDMLTWNHSGQIIDFKVMVRPLKAVRLIHENMGKMLAAQQQPSSQRKQWLRWPRHNGVGRSALIHSTRRSIGPVDLRGGYKIFATVTAASNPHKALA